jgi:succinate dehydrogenase (ubiquinone) cytochrome b560 subunit
LSIANRVTGSFLSGALYLGAVTYLLHPMYPAIDSAHLVDLVTSLPTWAKGSAKLIFAVPFTFHTFNGIRHLAWDIGYGESGRAWMGMDPERCADQPTGLTLKGMQAGAYITMAATAVSSIYLAFFV